MANRKRQRKDLYVCWIYLNGEKAYEDAGKLETTLLKAYNNILSSINDEELKKEPKKYKYPFANWRC